MGIHVTLQEKIRRRAEKDLGINIELYLGGSAEVLLKAATDLTDALSFLPYVHNADSYGYNSRAFPKGIPYETESRGELLNDRYHGKVAIVNAPTIGMTAVKADSGDMCRCAFAGLYSKNVR